MADVGRETRLALDPRLHGVGHGVEGIGQSVEVGVVLALETDVEGPGSEFPRGTGHPREGPHETAAVPETEPGGRCSGDCRCDDERTGDHAQGALHAGQGKGLVIARGDAGYRHADSEVGLTIERRESGGG